MIELILKASFAIGIAFLFYKLLLQQESFFAANRVYLIGCIALAFALPFISLPQLVSQQGYLAELFQQEEKVEPMVLTPGVGENAQLPMPDNTTVPSSAEVPAQLPDRVVEQNSTADTPAAVTQATATSGEAKGWLFWLTALYLFGVVVFALSLLFQLGHLLHKIISATDKIQDGGFVIVSTASRQAPCSFFRYIFIYPDDYDFETYEQIIAHEKIHARLGHSIDLMIAELAVVVLWFYPLIWLLRREIEKNNEYQTDAILLEKEQVQPDQYKFNLLQIAVPNKSLSITTNYNQSLLKQRIMMMNAKKSTPHAYWKYAFLAPLFFGTLLLINEPAASQSSPTTAATPSPEDTRAALPENLSEKMTQQVKEAISTSLAGITISTGEAAELPPMPAAPVPAPDAQATPSPVREPLPAPREPLATPRRISGISMNINGADTDMREGYWYSSREGNDYCIQFKGSKGSSNWNMSRCFASSAFQKQGNETFVLSKETGTLQFNGNLDAEVGQGKYTFTEDAGFRKYLAENNITSTSQNMMFHLFLGDVDKAYVAFLKKEYSDVSGNRLLELAIHGVPMASFQNYIALFQKYSQKKPSIQEVVSARIHGIDEAYVQELQRMGFADLSMKKMMEAKIHGVSTAYVESLKSAGFSNLTMDKIIEAKIHGVQPESIKEIQALGFGDLSLDKIIELKIHDVNASYISDLKASGLGDLSLSQVVEAKIHGLNPASIKEIRALGYKDLNFRDMMSAQIHGVNAAYVEDLKKAGFENLTMGKTVEAKIHGINSTFIKQAREKGYNLNSIDKYISLKIHGMAMESLKD